MFLLIAIFLDLIIGDPDFITHPVVIIGKFIEFLEKKFRSIGKGKKEEKIAGGILVLIVVMVTYFSVYLLFELVYFFNYYLGAVINIWLLATTIALKGLVDAGYNVYQYLLKNDLISARKAVGEIVGRDTENMNRQEIIRATVESLAENTADGIIAPIFFYLLGGTPLALTYKAVNTLDSMLGYKDEKYLFFGRAAAKLDDFVNFLPARLTGISFCLAAFFTGFDFKRAFKIMNRDAKKHPSPNAGYPEAAVAGILGLRLGGVNYYRGKKSFRCYLGDELREFRVEDISHVIRLIYWNVGLIAFFIILIIQLFI